jgi:hypothetical protein
LKQESKEFEVSIGQMAIYLDATRAVIIVASIVRPLIA